MGRLGSPLLLCCLLRWCLFGRLLDWRLCRLLSRGLLGRRLLGPLGSLWFLSRRLLGRLLLNHLGLLSNPVRSGSLASGSGGRFQGSRSDSLLQGEVEKLAHFGGVGADLVVCHDVLEDGLARRSRPVLQGRDGSHGHVLVRGMRRCRLG